MGFTLNHSRGNTYINQRGNAYIGSSSSDRALSAWNASAGSADADLKDELGKIRNRSRDLTRNNGIAAGYMQTEADNVIGNVLKLSAKPNTRLLGWTREQAYDWGKTTEAHFGTWADTTECDASRRNNLLGLTKLGIKSEIQNGDFLAVVRYIKTRQRTWRTALQMVEGDRLSTPTGKENDPNIRDGVEINKYGEPVAYYIRKTHPGDVNTGMALDEWIRIPATTKWGRKKVIHVARQDRIGQNRAAPILSSVLRSFKQLDKYSDAELDAAVVNALVAGVIKSGLNSESVREIFGAACDSDASAIPDYWAATMKENTPILRSGSILNLPIGADFESFDPSRPNSAFEDFMVGTLRHVSAGLNLPYELLVKDFSRTNYSSVRAALLEAWRYFNGRREWIKAQWLDPIYDIWLEEAVGRGIVEAPGFFDHLRYAYTRSKFIFAGRGWVDPVKESQAAKIRIEAGLSTMESECADQGNDWEDVLEQQAVEEKKRKELGLPSLFLIQGVSMESENEDGQTSVDDEDDQSSEDEQAETEAA